MDNPHSKKGLLQTLLNGTAKLRQEISEFLTNREEPQDEYNQQNRVMSENSIIDISNESYKISQNSPVINASSILTSKIDVPYWEHQYIYSYSEINSATQDQRRFYFYLKNKFYNQEFVDLEGNSNYAFILLFDLFQEYDRHQKIVLLESQLQLLGEFYPKTYSYASSFLANKLEAKGDYDGALRVRIEYQTNYYDYWKLGSKYKRQLNLTDNEVKSLNQLSFPNNNFSSIEYCRIEIIKLYLPTIEELSRKCRLEGSTLNEQLEIIADLVARKQFRYRLNSQNYKFEIESATSEIYSNIFKYCENAIREHYGHKRKLKTETYFSNIEVKTEFEIRVVEKVKKILSKLISKIASLDEDTDVELYAQNVSRWKIKFSELTSNYNDNAKDFVENILMLGKLNRRNSGVENIFFEASKFIAKSDKHASLTLYVYYLYHDLKSVNFDNKKLPKTIQKHLFENENQQNEFEKMINDLVSNRDLQKALKEISEIYAVKRKKIQLDSDSIEKVQQQLSGTVKLLDSVLNNEYEALNEFLLPELELMISSLQEKVENDENFIIAETSSSQENTSVSASIFRSDLKFSELQIETLELFQKHNLSVSQNEFENFANSNGALKNQLIDKLNEACYELLDDVLIEEEDEFYTIYENYYNKILK